MPTLHRDEFFSLEYYQASGYVRLNRSSTPFEELTQAAQALEDCNRRLSRLEPDGLGILLDWRKAKLTTKRRLHAIIIGGTDAFARHFSRRAVLVETGVGSLQMERLRREHSVIQPAIFTDETSAIEHVQRQRPSTRPSHRPSTRSTQRPPSSHAAPSSSGPFTASSALREIAFPSSLFVKKGPPV